MAFKFINLVQTEKLWIRSIDLMHLKYKNKNRKWKFSNLKLIVTEKLNLYFIVIKIQNFRIN